MPSDILQPDVACSTAQELVDALSPVGPYFSHAGPFEPWLFRGQGKAHPLLPSLYRKDSSGRYLWSDKFRTTRNLGDPGQLLLAERDLLVRFFEIADIRGLILPDDSQGLRSALETRMSERGEQLIPNGWDTWATTDDAASLVALAQHYGVPTRLLDWTRLPYVAAFFAAQDGYGYFAGGQTTEQLEVWALFYPLLGRHDAVHNSSYPIRVITAPSATNPNLKAQQGVFTLANPFYSGERDSAGYLPIDQMLQQRAQHDDAYLQGSKLQRFTLPVSEADQLLLKLAKLNVTRSLVFPGYQCIVDDLKTESRWR